MVTQLSGLAWPPASTPQDAATAAEAGQVSAKHLQTHIHAAVAVIWQHPLLRYDLSVPLAPIRPGVAPGGLGGDGGWAARFVTASSVNWSGAKPGNGRRNRA